MDLKHMVRESGRNIAVLQTIASEGTGIDEVVRTLNEARATPAGNAERAVRFAVVRTVRDSAVRRAFEMLDGDFGRDVFNRLRSGELGRTEARNALVAEILAEVYHAD
jgi:putative protein kinase ArgK-like GTPase of G3E family